MEPKLRPISQKIYEELCSVIPAGVNSPVRNCKSVGCTPPMVVASAYEDRIKDVDGYEYIDYCGSWGSLIHGHAHPYIVERVQKKMALGTSFGITTECEYLLAQKIISHMPSIERIRFVSSGTEATMSAARLARGFTGKDIIIKFAGNYHGHADFFLIQAGSGVFNMAESSSAGIPRDIVKNTLCLPYNDINALKECFNDPKIKDNIAGVILEPITGNMGVIPATQEFINALLEETKKHKALLIFDEVITGFRVGMKGAQGLYKVKPDLTCLGKIIGGGFPCAAFGGRKEIMEFLAPLGPVYQAGTLSGNPIAMEAGHAALSLLEEKGFYEKLKAKTDRLLNPLREYIQQKKLDLFLSDSGSMFTLFFGITNAQNASDVRKADNDRFAHFFNYLFARGIYIPPAQQEAWFVSMAHSDKNIDKTRDLILQYFKENI